MNLNTMKITFHPDFCLLTGTIEDGEYDPIEFSVAGETISLDTHDSNWVTVSSGMMSRMESLLDMDDDLEKFMEDGRRTKRTLEREARQLAAEIGFEVIEVTFV